MQTLVAGGIIVLLKERFVFVWTDFVHQDISRHPCCVQKHMLKAIMVSQAQIVLDNLSDETLFML